jgi:hypothetical protein
MDLPPIRPCRPGIPFHTRATLLQRTAPAGTKPPIVWHTIQNCQCATHSNSLEIPKKIRIVDDTNPTLSSTIRNQTTTNSQLHTNEFL